MLTIHTILCYLWLVEISNGISVETKLGALEGVEFLLESGESVHAFLGVPYAEPPIGKYRFEEPRPVGKWNGTWMAKASGPHCLQIGSKGIRGSEDCLYLDIYTPTVEVGSLMPVMVFIHGGAFKMGRGSPHTPKYLMKEANFIFVNLNYRLGPLGFLSTQDNVVPGNNGLKDQVVALKWVQDNIGAFGGDKDKVTIVGHSAGGASVHLHYLSPWSKDLFRNGISASGSALNPWALTENPLEKARALAASLGCPTSEHMVSCLKQRPGEHFFHNSLPVFKLWNKSPFTVFGPVIEKWGSNPFLSDHPHQLLSEGKVQDKPWLASMTTEEGLLSAAFFIERNQSLEELDSQWDSITPLLLDYNDTVSKNRSNTVSRLIRSHYFGEEGSVRSNKGKIIKMLSERLFEAGIAEAASMQALAMNSTVYLYRIGYMFKRRFTELFFKRKYGVSHLDDLMNIFQFYYSTEDRFVDISPPDKEMARILGTIWLNFMKLGIPEIGESSNWNPMSRIRKGSIKYLNITSPECMIFVEETDLGNQIFWNSLELE